MTYEKKCSAIILAAADKIPPFWIQDPELWFYHVESVFKGENITDSHIKFQIIISKVQIDVLVPVRDIIKCPGDKPYEKLKSRLVNTYLELETNRIQQLLKGKYLDNKKPSRLLKLMIQLAGYGTASGIVKTLWMNSLPQHIQYVLLSTGLEDINKLAEFADKLQETHPSERINAVDHESSDCYHQEEHYINESAIASLEAEIEDLSRQIALMNFKLKFNQSSSCNYRLGKVIPINYDYSDCMCYYHFKFREKARKCATPCSWTNINPASYNELLEPLR